MFSFEYSRFLPLPNRNYDDIFGHLVQDLSSLWFLKLVSVACDLLRHLFTEKICNFSTKHIISMMTDMLLWFII